MQKMNAQTSINSKGRRNMQTPALRTALGPQINDFLNDPDISEIYTNPDTKLWVNSLSKGRIDTGTTIDPKQALVIIKLISGEAKKTITEDDPELGTEIRGMNCRFQAEIPPIVKNPIFMIRKHASQVFTLDDYMASDTITLKQKEFIEKCIIQGKNILLVGATHSGKTTFLNALLLAISELTPSDRLVTLEDNKELQCKAADYTSLLTKKDRDLAKCMNMDHLLYITMRLSPTRIILGEVRDGAAWSLIKAWSTGHKGGVCTTHADSALKGLDRLEMLIKENKEASTGEFQKWIAEAVNVVISLISTRDEQGRTVRKVNEIIVLKDWDSQTQKYVYEEFN